MMQSKDLLQIQQIDKKFIEMDYIPIFIVCLQHT